LGRLADRTANEEGDFGSGDFGRYGNIVYVAQNVTRSQSGLKGGLVGQSHGNDPLAIQQFGKHADDTGTAVIIGLKALGNGRFQESGMGIAQAIYQAAQSGISQLTSFGNITYLVGGQAV
jgi:hypothetical protein